MRLRRLVESEKCCFKHLIVKYERFAKQLLIQIETHRINFTAGQVIGIILFAHKYQAASASLVGIKVYSDTYLIE